MLNIVPFGAAVLEKTFKEFHYVKMYAPGAETLMTQGTSFEQN